MFGACAEAGDQTEPLASARDQIGIDPDKTLLTPGGRPQATVIRAPGTCRAISRITPEDMTQSPMRLEVTNRTFLAVLVSVTRFWPSLRFPGFAISP